MHYFFCSHLDEIGGVAFFSSDERHHLFKTLRATPGKTIGLLDGIGSKAAGKIQTDGAVIITEIARHPAPSPKIHLFVAPPRKQKMDILLKQCAEIGIWSINPIITERSVATPDKTSSRWEVLLREGCKQSGNPYIPKLIAPTPFADVLQTSDKPRQNYFGAVETVKTSELTDVSSDIGWWVGPEGGFSDKEEDLLRQYGAIGINLVPYTMRVETAAICGAAIIMFEIRSKSCL